MLEAMQKGYGKKKGKNVFYASENKGNPGSGKWTVKDEMKRRVAKKEKKPKEKGRAMT